MAFLSDEFLVVLVGGRLYALAHGVRQKFAHFGVAAGAAVRGVDAAEVERLDASGQRRCEAAAFALCDECAAGGASGGGGDRVNHERASVDMIIGLKRPEAALLLCILLCIYYNLLIT